jgi:hypothetical protein
MEPTNQFIISTDLKKFSILILDVFMGFIINVLSSSTGEEKILVLAILLFALLLRLFIDFLIDTPEIYVTRVFFEFKANEFSLKFDEITDYFKLNIEKVESKVDNILEIMETRFNELSEQLKNKK